MCYDPISGVFPLLYPFSFSVFSVPFGLFRPRQVSRSPVLFFVSVFTLPPHPVSFHAPMGYQGGWLFLAHILSPPHDGSTFSLFCSFETHFSSSPLTPRSYPTHILAPRDPPLRFQNLFSLESSLFPMLGLLFLVDITRSTSPSPFTFHPMARPPLE